MVVYALMQAEAGIAEFIYLVCIFDVITNLVFDHPCRVDETEGVKSYQFIGQYNERTKCWYRFNERF